MSEYAFYLFPRAMHCSFSHLILAFSFASCLLKRYLNTLIFKTFFLLSNVNLYLSLLTVEFLLQKCSKM